MEVTLAECPICCDSFTKQLRKPVSCTRCQFTCCAVCFKQHCLSGTDIMCMNTECRALFSEDFVYKTLSSSFVKGEYRNKRKDTLLDREKSMMEETMPVIQAMTEKSEALERQKEIQAEMNRLIQEQKGIVRRCDRIISGQEEVAVVDVENRTRKPYLSKCPTTGCLGFLNTQYNCDLCKKSTCSKCFETKEEGHECDPDNIKTAEMLRKDTKGCPKCGEMIHKSWGCDQMYCTTCHTVFSWNTGKITTGIVHNPHYFQYMRQREAGIERNPNDIPCGGRPNWNSLKRVVKVCYPTVSPSNLGKLTLEVQRLFLFAGELRDIHIQAIQGPELFRQNLKNRILYMKKELDEEKFKTSIIRQDITSIRNREVLQVYTTLAVLIEDQLRNFMDCTTSTTFTEILDECHRIVQYINDIFHNLSKVFKMALPKVEYPILKQTNYVYLNRSSVLTIKKNGTKA